MSAPTRPQQAAMAAVLAVVAVAAPVAQSGVASTRTHLAVVNTATPDGDGWLSLAADAVDYAPAGLPDIDQRQGAWRVNGPQRAVWTHDGPVTVANALWWLDSQLEPDPRPPLEPWDGFDLVQAHGPWDDHAPANVAPVVADLAVRAGTNGPQRLLAVGTCMDQLRDGLNELLSGSRQRPRFEARVVDLPTLQDLAQPLAAGQPAVLLVGIWQQHDKAGWQRIGGHYVALAAVDTALGRLRISDPFRDATRGTDLVTGHNDAGNVSHDAYMLTPSLRPGPVLRLDGYLDDTAATTTLVANFAGLNQRHCNGGDTAWLDDARLEGQVEAALVIEPVVVPTETATPSATPTSRPTLPTPGPPLTATATITLTATITVTATSLPLPSATHTALATVTPTPRSTATATATATATPTATSTSAATATAERSAVPSATVDPPTATATPAPAPAATTGPGTVCGRVTAAGGHGGTAGVQVAALQADLIAAQTWSGADGQYCLFDVAAGTYLLRASHPACTATTVVVTLGGGISRVDLELACRRGSALLPVLLVQRPRSRTH
jgi:hypothetical protein